MGVATSVAQILPSHPPVATRNAIVSALNNAITARQSTVTLPSSELFDGVDNSCSTVNPLLIEIIYVPDAINPTSFILRRKMRSGGTIPSPYNHQLVDDLNNWLNAVWGMDLIEIPSFENLGWDCNTQQRYYTQSTTDGDAIADVTAISGEDNILSSSYIIDGVSYNGSSIATFSNSSPRSVKYISDKGTTSDPKRRFLADGYIKVQLPNNSNYVEISFDAETQKYNPDDLDDCGISISTTSAKLSITVGSSAGQNTSLAGFGAGGGADGANSTLLYGSVNGIVKGIMDCLNKWGHKDDESCSNPDPDSHIYHGRFYIANDGNLHADFYHGPIWGICSDIDLGKIIDANYNDEYCETAYCYGGQFSLDAKTLQLVYLPSSPSACSESCLSQKVPCILFCDQQILNPTLASNVLSAQSQVFSDRSLLLTLGEFGYQSGSDFEKGERGKWRQIKNYIYRDIVKPGSNSFTSIERNYDNAGVFNMHYFDWENLSNNNTNWLNSVSVARYSQNGDAVEEQDIFGISSSAKFGYNQQLPIAVAKNSSYPMTFFQSFEGYNGIDYPNGLNIIQNQGHSGYKSMIVRNNSLDAVSYNFIIPDNYTSSIVLRYWVKVVYDDPVNYNRKTPPIDIQIYNNTNAFSSTTDEYVAQTGEWTLYESVIMNPPAGIYSIRVQHILSGDNIVYIDDIRAQPISSEMICYVYDANTFKPTVMFDDQHFGMYYQYNGEGKLIRKIKETTHGIKVVQETQYHTPFIQRSYASSTVSSINNGSILTKKANRGKELVLGSNDGGEPIGIDFDIFDAEIGLNKSDIKIFGIESDKFSEYLKKIMNELSVDSLYGGINLPQIEKIRLLHQLSETYQTIDSLSFPVNYQDSLLQTDSINREVYHSQALDKANQHKDQLLNQLGLSNEQALEIVKKIRTVKKEELMENETPLDIEQKDVESNDKDQ